VAREPVVAAFIQIVKRHFGVTTHRDLALALGYKSADEHRTVGRWANGSGPNFRHLMTLLLRAEWLTAEGRLAYLQAVQLGDSKQAAEALGKLASESGEPEGPRRVA